MFSFASKFWGYIQFCIKTLRLCSDLIQGFEVKFSFEVMFSFASKFWGYVQIFFKILRLCSVLLQNFEVMFSLGSNFWGYDQIIRKKCTIQFLLLNCFAQLTHYLQILTQNSQTTPFFPNVRPVTLYQSHQNPLIS